MPVTVALNVEMPVIVVQKQVRVHDASKITFQKHVYYNFILCLSYYASHIRSVEFMTMYAYNDPSDMIMK